MIRRLGVNIVTYYRWRKEFGAMKVEQAKRSKDLERENAQLKKLNTVIGSQIPSAISRHHLSLSVLR